jgi:hypothetical protein
MSIGGGEWMFGPAVAVKYSSDLLWMVTVSCFLQVILNQEVARYVMYTGETGFAGFMRTKPGPKFWGWVYPVLALLQVGWPGNIAACAAAIFATFAGRIPGAGDAGSVLAWGYIGFGTCALVLLFGGIIERGLEKMSTFIVLWIFLFLVLFNILFVPAGTWWKVFKGLFAFGVIPQGADWVLLGSFAAYAGAGGLGNVWTQSWMRDKGYGMGSIVGAIPSAIAGKEIALSKIGSVFDPNKESNLKAWKTWWKYLWVDQGVVFGLGGIFGMYFCILMAVEMIPAGTDLRGIGAGAYQAEYMMKYWKPFWFLALFTGFWILWGTQLAILDGYSRTVTDVIWSSTKKPHTWKSGPKTIYYITLLSFIGWGCILINLTLPLTLLMIAACMGGFNFVVASIHTLVMNNKFLPPQVRPPLWRNICLVAMAAFFGFLTFAMVGKQTGWWKI